jgi:hypothetical protein
MGAINDTASIQEKKSFRYLSGKCERPLRNICIRSTRFRFSSCSLPEKVADLPAPNFLLVVHFFQGIRENFTNYIQAEDSCNASE